jgi:tripartite-type tricarboxylate transporter receptor subunit TctC
MSDLKTDIPTMAEQGYKRSFFVPALGLGGPKGLSLLRS